MESLERMTREKTINLSFRREDFEEIYNLKKEGSIILNRHTRIYFWIVIVLGIAFSASLFYSTSENRYVTVSLMFFVWLILFTIVLYSVAKPILKWKRSVLNFIKTNESYKKHVLILTENCIELVEDEARTLEKWSSISNIKIEADYLILSGSKSFIFPKRSMAEAEFEYLKEFVTNKFR